MYDLTLMLQSAGNGGGLDGGWEAAKPEDTAWTWV